MIDLDLPKAYQSKKITVSGREGKITLHVEENDRLLDALLAKLEAKNCAFRTPWNPGSIRLTGAKNKNRQNTLIAELRDLLYNVDQDHMADLKSFRIETWKIL